MRNRVVGTIGRVHKRQAKKANGEICVIVDDLPIVINMSLVRNMTAHETLFCKHNPHVCIVWHDGKYTNIPMESYEDAENFIKDAYNRCRTYTYV